MRESPVYQSHSHQINAQETKVPWHEPKCHFHPHSTMYTRCHLLYVQYCRYDVQCTRYSTRELYLAHDMT